MIKQVHAGAQEKNKMEDALSREAEAKREKEKDKR